MKKTTALIFIILFCSSSAFAYDDLITGASPHVTPMNRGLVTLGVSLVYLNAGDSFDTDGDKQPLDDTETDFRVPFFLVYRMTERFQPFALFPVVSKKTEGESESGLGDIWFGAKYAAISEGILTLRGAVNIANGDGDKGLGAAGGFFIDIAALGERWLIEETLAARGQLGMRWYAEDGDSKLQPGMGMYVTGELGYEVRDAVRLHGGFEFMTFGDSKQDGKDVGDSAINGLDLKAGVGYNFYENFYIITSLIYTIMGKNTSSDIGFRISFGNKF